MMVEHCWLTLVENYAQKYVNGLLGARHKVAFFGKKKKKTDKEIQSFEFKLPYHPGQEKPTLPHSVSIQLGA